MQDRLSIGTRRELFCDDALWCDLGGAVYRVHRPVMREIALGRDTVADNRLTSYYNILYDGSKYAMYYVAHDFDKMCGKWPHQHICRAESEDGIHWIKPDYGLYNFMGSTHNNIVYLFDDDLLDNFCAFYDTNSACPANQRYKAVAERVIDDVAVLNGLCSPDGIHWQDLGTILREGNFDTLNTCYFDQEAGCYRVYVRAWERHEIGGLLGESGEDEKVMPNAVRARIIATATSQDFIHWGSTVPLEYGESPRYQMYSNNIGPYYRAPHIFMGFPTRYYERQWSINFEKMPFADKRRARIEHFKAMRTGTAVSDGLFMTSRDGVNFRRFDDDPIFPSGIEGDGNWIYGDAYPAYGMVQTPSPRPGEPDEISMFLPDNKANALRRCSIRLDGFVSLHLGSKMTELYSKCLTFTGKCLEFNFVTTAAGYFVVQLEDARGNAYPGFAMQDCDETFGDTTARLITWRGNADLSALADKPVCLRICGREVDFYSFRFTNMPEALPLSPGTPTEE